MKDFIILFILSILVNYSSLMRYRPVRLQQAVLTCSSEQSRPEKCCIPSGRRVMCARSLQAIDSYQTHVPERQVTNEVQSRDLLQRVQESLQHEAHAGPG